MKLWQLTNKKFQGDELMFHHCYRAELYLSVFPFCVSFSLLQNVMLCLYESCTTSLPRQPHTSPSKPELFSSSF